MPEMGGIEFSQVVRANGNFEKASLPILALTANVLKEDRDKNISVGINGVVLKPFSERNLIDNIAAALTSRNMLVNN
jgi:CheY-like chemotaxis protein